MNFIENWNNWADNHHSPVYDALRIALGIFIFYKGLFFMQHTDVLAGIISPENQKFNDFWITHYVAMSHLAGGVFIAIGLLTRLAVVIQIPILAGAVFVNLGNMDNMAEISQSIISLGLLFFFTFYGSGRWSADHFFGIGVK